MTIDKYRPVDATPKHLTRPGPAYVGALGLAIGLGLFSPDTMRQTATFNEDLSPRTVSALMWVADTSEALGVGGLRRSLDAWAAPLDQTTRLLKKQRKPTTPDVKNGEPTPPPEPSVPPGERWQALQGVGRAHNVLIVGASSIQYAIGTELERELRDGYDLEVHRKGKVATGLTRPDVFDWPAEIARLQEEFQPDMVIGQFGGNDGQNIVDIEGKPHNIYTEGWEIEYGRRITELTQDIASRGARFVIIGMPVARSDKYTKKMRWLNALTKRYLEDAGGTFVEIADLSVDDNGDYQPSVRFGGTSGRMRMDDGIHFTRLGGQYVAWHLAHKLEREMVLVPKAPEAPDADSPAPERPATAYNYTVPSEVRDDSRFLAFVPDEVPTEGLPVWYLLHGAYDDWTAWSTHAHDTLQQLATDEDVIIVTPDGEPFGYWLDGTVDPSHRIATWFTDDLVPFVDSTLPSNGQRAISGLSMGGHGALTLAMSNPGMFEAATSMSGAVDLTASSRQEIAQWLGDQATHLPAWEANSAIHQIAQQPAQARELALMISCGTADKNWWDANQRLHELLDVQRIDHTWDPQDGGHTWDVWLDALPRHASFVGDVLHPAPPAPPPPKPDAAPDPNKNQP